MFLFLKKQFVWHSVCLFVHRPDGDRMALKLGKEFAQDIGCQDESEKDWIMTESYEKDMF